MSYLAFKILLRDKKRWGLNCSASEKTLSRLNGVCAYGQDRIIGFGNCEDNRLREVDIRIDMTLNYCEL
jgi:hypothetical protein